MGVFNSITNTFPINQEKTAYKYKKEQPKNKDLQHFSLWTLFLIILPGISARCIAIIGLVRRERWPGFILS
jgi:hypothetical protein